MKVPGAALRECAAFAKFRGCVCAIHTISLVRGRTNNTYACQVTLRSAYSARVRECQAPSASCVAAKLRSCGHMAASTAPHQARPRRAARTKGTQRPASAICARPSASDRPPIAAGARAVRRAQEAPPWTVPLRARAPSGAWAENERATHSESPRAAATPTPRQPARSPARQPASPPAPPQHGSPRRRRASGTVLRGRRRCSGTARTREARETDRSARLRPRAVADCNLACTSVVSGQCSTCATDFVPDSSVSGGCKRESAPPRAAPAP